MNRAQLRTLLTGKAPPAPAPPPDVDPARAEAREAARSLVADIREQLADLRPETDPKTRRALPYYTLVESFRPGVAHAWPRPVTAAPESFRRDIRREPEAWVLVELVGRPGPPHAFRLSELEAGNG